MRSFSISATPLDIKLLSDGLRDTAAGAYASFEGWVRDHNEGRQVARLKYEVFHALAEAEGERIIREAVQQFGLTAAACVHREGDLALGDCAVWVGVAAPHRAEAFAACRFIIDAVKHRLPIWKKEFYAGGETAWVNCAHKGEMAHHHTAEPAIEQPTPEAYYARQMRLPEIGATGQHKLAEARVLVVGLGGLGSAAVLSLASAGVGTIGLAEHDRLEASNLHRQMIYDAADIGEPKSMLAAERLRGHNPFIRVVEHDTRLTAGNAGAVLAGYDLILDCTDNFCPNYRLNDAAILLDKPVVQASIYRFEGQLLTIDRHSEGGCLRCLWPEPPAHGAVGDCAETGVLGTVPALFGTLQANEAIKHILGLPVASRDRVLLFDLLTLQSQPLARHKRHDCPLCGAHPSITQLQAEQRSPLEITAAESDDLASLAHRYHLVDLREMDEGPELTGTFRLPFTAFATEAMPYASDLPILLFCARGGRSLKAAETLRKAGWHQAFSLAGGIAALASSPNKRQAA